MNELWEARQVEWERKLGKKIELLDELEELIDRNPAEVDLELLASLYVPPLDHVSIPREDDDDYNQWHVEVDGVRIRYLEEMQEVTMLVKGELPDSTIQMLVDDLREKLARLEGVSYQAEKLSSP